MLIFEAGFNGETETPVLLASTSVVRARNAKQRVGKISAV
jgi:hypothetical protein